MSREVLEALAARCEREEPSDELDKAIAQACGVKWSADEDGNFGGYGILPRRCRFSRSLDAAVTLLPAHCYWTVGKGKETDDEPVYGAIVETAARLPKRIELGAGESDRHEALALCAAALRARATLA